MPSPGDIYDSFIAPTHRGDIEYIAGNIVEYPTNDQINIFGPLYVPRVYGKDLTAFEIASSGSVAVTLNDVHSFDLARDTDNSNIVLQTYDQDSFAINVDNSNMYLHFATSNDRATLYSANDVTIKAMDVLSLEGNTVQLVIGENFNVNASNIGLTGLYNVEITGTNGHVLLSASNDSSTLSLAEDSAVLYAELDVVAKADRDLFLSAQSNVYITASNADMVLSASNNAMSMTFDSSSNNVSISSANAFIVSTVGQINMTSTTDSVLLRAAGTDVTVELDSTTSNLNMYAKSNISIDADAALSLSSSNQATITAGNSIAMMTGNDMTVQASNNISIQADATLSLAADSQAILAAGSSILMNTGNDLTVAASNGISITASNTIAIEAITDSLNLSAAGGKVYADFDAQSTSLTIGTSNDVTVTASNSISLASRDAVVTASSNLTLTGVSNVSLVRDAGNYVKVQNDDTIRMWAGNSNIITAHHDRVFINGDVQVNGVIDSVDIHQSNLMIADRTVNLAFDPALGPLPDGANTNSGAGLIVSGQYGAASNARSLIWNWNDGMDKLGTNDVDGESYWDVRGGQLRISHSNATKEIAFGFRINEYDELELVKKTGANTFKRIAKFGRTLV